MPTIEEIAQDIYSRARRRGVNPYFALGVAHREGLNPNTIGSPYFGNPDSGGTSFGPWQLYDRSKDPSRLSGGGEASEFQRKYGAAPSAANWQQQNEYAIDRMASMSPKELMSTWYAIRDAGGIGSITNIGQKYAHKLGLSSGGATTPSSPAMGTTLTSAPVNIGFPKAPPATMDIVGNPIGARGGGLPAFARPNVVNQQPGLNIGPTGPMPAMASAPLVPIAATPAATTPSMPSVPTATPAATPGPTTPDIPAPSGSGIGFAGLLDAIGKMGGAFGGGGGEQEQQIQAPEPMKPVPMPDINNEMKARIAAALANLRAG